MCQPDQTVQECTLHLAPFDSYVAPNSFADPLSISNMSCIITPKITTADATYTSTTKRFNVDAVDYIQSSTKTIPNETAGVVDQIISVAETYWGNSG